MRSKNLALWLAGGVPWIAYALSCSAHAYWLDSGEFVAAAVRLDISHPPGHPLTELYGKAFTLLPFGSLPFRVAIGQAFATALACAFACRASANVLKLQRVPDGVRWPCAVFAAWTSAFTYGLWFQAVRPEVYALQTLCTSLVLERVSGFLAHDDQRGRLHAARYAGPACLALGLGLANHHFTALFVVPAMVVPAFQLVRSGRLRCLIGAGLLGSLGLATYAYLPLRAARGLPANLGDPTDWSRFVWVMSARVYQHGAATQTTQPFVDRLADVVVLLTESFRVLPLVAAVVGLYVLLRIRTTRAAGLFLALALVPILLARAYLGPVRSNPDVLGYFGSAFLVLGMLAGSTLAELVRQLATLGKKRIAARGIELAPWSRQLTWVLPLLAACNLTYALERSTLADFHATDSVDEERLRSLPARSVVVETMPQTVFRHWELDAVERLRPDIAQVPVPFLTHPGMRETLLARSPGLQRVVDGYLNGNLLRCEDLAAQASSRTTYLELDVRVPPACFPALAASHLLHRVKLRAPQPAAAARQAALEQTYAPIYRDLGDGLAEPETLRQLLAIHYLNAAQLAAAGERTSARAEIARAKQLAPADAHVRALAAALGNAGEGPLAIEPFLDL